ncbi:IdgA domain-containing protein [Pleurostoma richardsiae]|uniref:IdgA domain-containing protein n=1 Tax=Pleurostoma richardsiae TaxID=41990 RepID=A0AA38RUK1_9PEZI|nr:IdgA domain-containing protein [Pleurostoma richardsiae]
MTLSGQALRLTRQSRPSVRSLAISSAHPNNSSWQCSAAQGRRASHLRRSFYSTKHGAPPPSGLAAVLQVSEEVADAVATNKPVVALESTIYTHGALGKELPAYLESVVRQHGGIPATIGVLDGIPRVGLTPAEIERMVHEGARKVSRRDLAYIVGTGMTGRKVHGGTTISGTMVLSRLAGIRVFGTGGLGGVHRGGQDSMDVSADLTELGRTRVAVVSSGCKGFLDIARTLEFLETQGVLVGTFADGRTGNVDFPAFWARDSGIKSPFVVPDEKQAAAMILAQEQLGIETGMLFANPIAEEHGIPKRDMEKVISIALREADEKGIAGSANTPFILKRIAELTHGKTVPANKELVRANVARATRVAVELSKLQSTGTAADDVRTATYFPPRPKSESSSTVVKKTEQASASQVDILVAGSVAVDLSCDYAGDASAGAISVSPKLHTSNPATITQTVGGVGHNVALAAHRANYKSKVRLCSMVGDDIAGASILSSLESSGLDTSYIRQLGHEYHSARTAQYIAVNDADKNLMVAMADMAILTSHSFPSYWTSAVAAAKPKWLVVDGNWSEQDIQTWLRAGRKNHSRIAFEPVSTVKAARLFPKTHDDGFQVFPHARVELATPNQYELAAMYAAAKEHGYFDASRWFEVVDSFGMRGARDRFVRLTSSAMTDAGIPIQSIQLLPYIPTIITKMGANGALLTMTLGREDPRLYSAEHERYILARGTGDNPHVGGVYMRLFPPAEKVTDVVSVNGVGDTFLGTLVAGLAQGGKVEDLVNVAQKAAVLTLRSHHSVSHDLGVLRSELLQAAGASDV